MKLNSVFGMGKKSLAGVELLLDLQDFFLIMGVIFISYHVTKRNIGNTISPATILADIRLRTAKCNQTRGYRRLSRTRSDEDAKHGQKYQAH